MASHDWQTLTRLSGGSPFYIERVRLADQEIAVEGRFDVPPLALLAPGLTYYITGFSKCLGAGLRVAYVCAPSERAAHRYQ